MMMRGRNRSMSLYLDLGVKKLANIFGNAPWSTTPSSGYELRSRDPTRGKTFSEWVQDFDTVEGQSFRMPWLEIQGQGGPFHLRDVQVQDIPDAQVQDIP